MKLVYALMTQLLPRNKGDEPKTVMGTEVYPTLREANEAHRVQRHQNLPLKSWVVHFEDPRP